MTLNKPTKTKSTSTVGVTKYFGPPSTHIEQPQRNVVQNVRKPYGLMDFIRMLARDDAPLREHLDAVPSGLDEFGAEPGDEQPCDREGDLTLNHLDILDDLYGVYLLTYKIPYASLTRRAVKQLCLNERVIHLNVDDKLREVAPPLGERLGKNNRYGNTLDLTEAALWIHQDKAFIVDAHGVQQTEQLSIYRCSSF
jgi:hypothetical protein